MTDAVAIVGGGITGLVAALDLSASGHDVHLFESAPALGGKIAETELAGRMVPTGPDAFLARRPELFELVSQLGLDSELISPVARSARIFRDGLLHPIPPSVLGIPATADLAASGLISWKGAERAALDLDAPDDRPNCDESVGELVRRRLGDEVMEYLVDPLLGGINAGNADLLSVEAGAPQIDVLRKKHRSLITAAAATLAAAPHDDRPVFGSVRGGLNRLVERLTTELEARPNCELHLNSPGSLQRTGDAWIVNGVHFDHVLLTVPAWTAAVLLRDDAPEVATELAAIDYSSVGFAVLELPVGTINVDASISGVLVPRVSGLMVTAVSFASHKWPALSEGGQQLLRISVGRRDDQRWQNLSEGELFEHIRTDLSTIFDTTIPDGPQVLTTWNQSLPQYDVNHVRQVARIDAATAAIPSLTVTGAWRDGLGLPACVKVGREAAAALL